jgi:hypothetical protein
MSRREEASGMNTNTLIPGIQQDSLSPNPSVAAPMEAAMPAPYDHPFLRDVRFERRVTQVHTLGPRVLVELFRELGATTFRMTEIEAAVARYAAIDPDHLTALGGDRFPPRPSLRVAGERHG